MKMVWWIHKLYDLQSYTRIPKDIIVPSSCVMLNCKQRYTDTEIFALWGSGVNIFLVDRTVHDEEYFESIKKSVNGAQDLIKMEYYRPYALALCVSINELVEIDERVDILILKNATDREDVIEFKKRNDKVNKMPILLWIKEIYIEDMDQLIAVVDGVVVDEVIEDKIARRNRDFCPKPISICNQAHKPVFCYNASLIEEYGKNQRRDILPFAQKVFERRLDGVILEDSPVNIAEVVQSLVTAAHYLEIVSETENDCFEFGKKLKIPVLPPLSAALSACMAAVKSGASAIFILTATGRSVRWVSCVSPLCHIIAITTRPSTARLLHIYRKVIPLLYTENRATNWEEEWKNRVRFGTNFALRSCLFGHGAKLVVLAPSAEGVGYCNEFKIVSAPFKCN